MVKPTTAADGLGGHDAGADERHLGEPAGQRERVVEHEQLGE